MKRIHQARDDRRITCLSETQLESASGRDICIVGYNAVDEDGDGRIDFLIPIYAPCGGAEHRLPPFV